MPRQLGSLDTPRSCVVSCVLRVACGATGGNARFRHSAGQPCRDESWIRRAGPCRSARWNSRAWTALPHQRLATKSAPDGWFEFGRPSPEEHVLTYAFIGNPGQEYKLENIPPGHYYVMAGRYRPSMHRSQLGACKEIDLKEGQSLLLDFDLGKP